MPTPSNPSTLRTRPLLAVPLMALAFAGCAVEAPEPARDVLENAASPAVAPGAAEIRSLLAQGQPVFGIFSGPKTREQGATMAASTDADFILYSMESGPFDVQGLAEYLSGMEDAQGAGAMAELPVLLRVPPIDDVALTREQLDAALPTGIGGIVFPHVARPDQAQASAELLGTTPAPRAGAPMDVLIVEDREGIANADAIVATPGLDVVFAGPGDLRRAYDGDMEAVEAAIQTVLTACMAHGVTCGITAGVDDMAMRLEQGWGMIIVTEPEAVAVGLEASGRTQVARSPLQRSSAAGG